MEPKGLFLTGLVRKVTFGCGAAKGGAIGTVFSLVFSFKSLQTHFEIFVCLESPSIFEIRSATRFLVAKNTRPLCEVY